MPEDPDDPSGPHEQHPDDADPAPGPDEGGAAGGGEGAPLEDDERGPRRGRRVGSAGLSSAVPDRPEPGAAADVDPQEASGAEGDRARSQGGPTRRPRRDFLVDVHEELAEHRRQLRETTGHTAEALGLLSEALPRVDELTRTVDTLAGRVDYLLERIDQPRSDELDDEPGSTDPPGFDADADGPGADDERPAGESDPPSGRRPRLAEKHVPARIARDHGLIGPINAGCWPLLGVDAAAAQWEALALFIARTLHPYYQPTRGELPDCWPAHPRCVVELSWLHRTYQSAALKQAPPAAMAEWHTRWLPAALDTLTAATSSCRPGHHHDPAAAQSPGGDRAASTSNAATSTPRSETLGPMATRAPVPNAHTPRPDPDYLSPDPRGSGITGHPGEGVAWQPDPRERRAGGPPPAAAAPSPGEPDPAAAELSHPSFWLPHYRRAAVADLEHRAAVGHHARHEPESREFAVTRADPAGP